MPKLITEPQVRMIAKMIRAWPTDQKLTWEAICNEAQAILNWMKPPTRQGLEKRPAIKFAYSYRKAIFYKERNRPESVPRPRSLKDATVKISKLTEENAILRSELSKMAEIANRFIYNASLAGLSREKLMAPLPLPRKRGE